MKQEEERRLKIISEIEARSPKISDPWAYSDKSDDDDVVIQKESAGFEMVEALRESNTIDHPMKGLNNPTEISLREGGPKNS